MSDAAKVSDCCAVGPKNDVGICPRCKEHSDWVAEGVESEGEVLAAVIATANHSPNLSEQLTLVAAMERIALVIQRMRDARPCQEHTMAIGKLRDAIRYEKDLEHRMMQINQAMGGALRQIAEGN